MAKKEIVKKPVGAIVSWDAEMAKYAAEASAAEKTPSGQFVSTAGGILSVAGAPVKGNALDVVIVDYILENTFYEERFDPANPQPPVCYAFGRTEDEMSPHDDSGTKQHDQCLGCPQNEWGTADTGKGKACKNQRRLALLHADSLSTPKGIADGEVLFMRVPVTSGKNWAAYVKGLAANFSRPPFGIVTRIGLVKDQKTQFKLTFEPLAPLTPEALAPLMKRREAVMSTIAFPYQKAGERTQQPAKKANNRGRKFA